METLSGKAKVIYGIGNNFAWSLGYSTIPIMAYLLPDWRDLQIAISVPLALNVLFAFLFPESPRWLLTKGHLEKSEKVINKIVKFNGRTEPGQNFLEPIEEKETESGWRIFIEIFKSSYLRRASIILFYLFLANSITYLGLSLSYGTLIPDGSLYLNILISGLTEFPAYGLAVLVVFYAGRRWPMVGSYFLGGTFLLLMLATLDNEAASIALSAIGKFGITAAFGMLQMYSMELFPTGARNAGLGAATFISRIGSVVSPIVGNALGQINRIIPIIIFGASALLGAFLALLLPETRGKNLPNTIEEGEKMCREDKSAFNDCRKRKSSESDLNSTASS